MKSPALIGATVALALAVGGALYVLRDTAGAEPGQVTPVPSVVVPTAGTPPPSTVVARPAPPLAREFAPTLPGQLDRISTEEIEITEDLIRFLDYRNKEPIGYVHLKKNAKRYAGKPIALTGKIIEIQEGEEGTFARVGLNGNNDDVFAVGARFQTDFVENNWIGITGYLAGAFEYTSQAGWNVTIPAVAARHIVSKRDFDKRFQAALKKSGYRIVKKTDEE